MTYEKRKKIRVKKKVFRILVISFVFTYLIFRAVPSLLASNAKTILPEKGTLIESFSAQGFMIKNETVVKASGSGEVNVSSIEGKRIAAGVEVAHINSLNDTSSLKQELIQIEESISSLEASEKDNKIIDSEKGKIQEVQSSLVNELQNMIASGDFKDVYLLKGKIALYDEKNKDISFANTLAGQSLENLKLRRENIDTEIKSNHMKYYSNYGGIISYVIDGYEEIYLPKDFENYTYDKLVVKESKENMAKSEVSVGEPIYKIIDNFEWYMALKIEDLAHINDFEEGNNIIVEIDNAEIRGKIVAINITNDKAAMVVRFNTRLHELYNVRFSKVNIIKYKKDGYKIPTKSIVNKDAVKGVYIKDKSGIVKFRPVSIIGEDDNYTYVDIGDSNGNIKVSGEEQGQKTITLFDEVFLNVLNIKEGQILN